MLHAQLEHMGAERGWQLVASTHCVVAVVAVVGSTTLFSTAILF
jgi:hypothetical protein